MRISWAAMALACTVASATLSARPQSGRVALEQHSVTADDGTPLIVSEGTVRVPELRDGSRGGSIDLAVIRIARAPTPGRSAHVVLAGGPGDSGVELVRSLARRGGASLLDLFGGDLVGIDQRGTGRTLPHLASPLSYGIALDTPGSPAEWLPRIEKASRAAADALRSRGILLRAYNTQESADDVDDVRLALGYDRVTLWGRSYGSHLALATLRRHPTTIERVILANPEGPDDTLKRPSRIDAVLDRLGRLVASDMRLGQRVPDLRRLMHQVLDRLETSPVTSDARHPVTGETVRVGIGKFDVQWLTAQALGDPRTAATLPAAYLQMADGDFRRIAQLALVQRIRMGVGSAMKHLMDLSSGATAERRALIEREAAVSLLGNAINFPLMALGDAWGNPDLGEPFRRPVKSTVPVLILAGDLDPRTPIENGREIAQHLTNAHLVTIRNGGHNFDMFGSEQIRRILAEFLRGTPLTVLHVEVPPPTFAQ